MIFSAPPPQGREEEVIRQVEGLRHQLRHHVADLRSWTGSIRRLALARAVQASNTIEGINMTLDDVLAVTGGNEPLESDHETLAAVAGYRDAMTYVLQLSDDPHFDYSEALIRSLHFMIVKHDLRKSPGRWRPGAIYIHSRDEIVYEGPDAAAVPDLVAQLVEELRERNKHAPPLVRAAMAHLNLVMIHPFRDGNGRVARCLQTLVLAREGILAPEFCSIEEYLGRNTQAYYDVLAQVGAGYWQPHNDARPWIRFCLTAHYRQARTILRRFNEGSRLWQLTEHRVQQLGLPDRVIPALWDAACGFRVRNSTYRSMIPDEDISEQVASRDLKLLVDNDLLVPFGSKRGRFYTASTQTKRLRAKAVEAKVPIEDPFAELPRDQASTGPVFPP